MCCRLSKAGFQDQVCQDMYVAAQFAPMVPWVMHERRCAVDCRRSIGLPLSFARLFDDASRQHTLKTLQGLMFGQAPKDQLGEVCLRKI